MKHTIHAIYILLSLIFIMVIPVNAYSEEFRPLRITPMMLSGGGHVTIKLETKYLDNGQSPSYQKLYVKILHLGSLSDTQLNDELQAPAVVRTQIETSYTGHAVIHPHLEKGKYLLVISYDGMEEAGLEPFRTPFTIGATYQPCVYKSYITPETGRTLYRSGTSIPLRLAIESSCPSKGPYTVYVETNDGETREVLTISSDNPQFTYQPSRKGTFSVRFAVGPDHPNELIGNRTPYLISHPASNDITIDCTSANANEITETTLYYYEDLIEPEANIHDYFFNTQIHYKAVAEAASFDLDDLRLKLCKQNADKCVTLEPDSDKTQRGIATFTAPITWLGTVQPHLYIGETPYDIALPEITLPAKTPRNITCVGAFLILCGAIVWLKKRRAKAFDAQLPPVPQEHEVCNNTICEDYIKTCFEAVTKHYIARSINWDEETIESYYQSEVINKAAKSNRAFEKYCFSTHLLLKRNQYTVEDLEHFRQESLKLL